VALIMGQIQLAANASVQPAIYVPPGAVSVVLYSTVTPTTWLGTSVNMSTANGLVMHTVPTSFNGWMTSKGTQLYALNANTASAFNYILLTDQ